MLERYELSAESCAVIQRLLYSPGISADMRLAVYDRAIMGFNIWIRPIFPQDWQAFVPILTNAEYVRYYGEGKSFSVPDIEKRVAGRAYRNLGDVPEELKKYSPAFIFSVIDHEGVAGEVFYFRPQSEVDAGRMEIAYAIVPNRAGRGYAVKASQLIMDHLGGSFVATAHPNNIGSYLTLEKLGFILDISRLNDTQKFGSEQPRNFYIMDR